MKISGLFVIYFTMLIAEIGDKTQLATMLFATEHQYPPWLIFLVCSAALITSTAIAVLVGNLASRYLTMVPLKLIAGVAFILIGVWMVVEYWR
ncbi:MAG: TMEM165/GDT1 family protein [Legionellales bacterium]|nr:TMEM165/GDT1 family protein [Legionellales bacterium]